MRHALSAAVSRLNRWATLGIAGTLATLCASPGAHAATLVAGDPATSFDLKQYAGNLVEPTDIAIVPDGRGVITQRRGGVVIRKTDGTLTDAGIIPVITNQLPEQGLLGVVADPDFATNKTLYFYASAGTNPANRHQVLKIALGDDNKLSATRPAIIDKGLEGPANHNGGGLVIHKDADGVNRLYVGVGDTGHNHTPPVNRYGTCLNKPNGKILRVNLDGSIPADNPLNALTMVSACDTEEGGALTMAAPDKRIFAWGMRNPYRFSIDDTHKLWIGDVGEVTQEEVSVGGKGEHFGWPFVEGTAKYAQAFQPANSCMGITPSTACTPPVHTYTHAYVDPVTNRNTGRNCIIGGPIMNGCNWPAPWSSRYIFGDHGSGEIVTLDVNAAHTGITGGEKPFANTGTAGLSSLRMGIDGALYIVQDISGRVDQVKPKGAAACTSAPDAGAPAPDPGRDASAGSGGSSAVDASLGSGGSSGAGGGSASGGASGSGGSATGGSSAGDASGVAGDATSGSGGSNATGTGGTPSSGGSSGSQNTGGSSNGSAGTTPASGDSGGCSCSTASMGRSSTWAGLAALGAFGTAFIRRSRNRKRRSQ